MYCPFCGAWLEEGAAFCPACGAAQNTSIQQPNGYTVNEANNLPMKWFKFLIYFALFAGAVLNTISGISMLTGAAYDGAADLVYGFFDGLKGLDIFIGLAMIAAAAFAVYTRFRLSGFYKNGPTMLLLTYAASVVIQLIYIIGVFCILPSSVTGEIDMSSYIANIATSVVMIFVNLTYFKKRAHLFTK